MAAAEAEAEELVWGQVAVLVAATVVALTEALLVLEAVLKAAEPETRYLIP